MQKRIFLFAILVLAGSLSLHAQIRDYVCVVRPVYSVQTGAFLESAAQKFSEAGYRDIADALKKGEGRSFGSGFFFVTADGKKLVVTNRHVVQDAETASIEFETSDGTRTGYEKCPVIAVDDDLDLALIQLDAAFPLSKGLFLATSAPEDGAEIWSAGYPGLGNDPAWQLGKGNITNAFSRVPQLVDPRLTTLIQHSAPVDPGNSGGPLLLANKKRTGGYEVVGVNTWKAVVRQAANFSMPASMVQSFINRSTGAILGGQELAGLSSRVEAFIRASEIKNTDDKNERLRRFSRFLSFEYVMKNGQDDLLKALSTAPTAVRNEVMDTLSDSSFIEAMRLACAWQLDVKLQENSAPVSLSLPENGAPIESAAVGSAAVGSAAAGSDGATPVSFTASSGNTYNVQWKKNLTSWQIVSTDIVEMKQAETAQAAEKKKSTSDAEFSFDAPYEEAFLLDYRPFKNSAMYGLSSLYNDTFIAYGITAATGMYKDPSSSVDRSRVLEMGLLFRLQVPFNFGYACLLPYGEVRAGLHFVPELVDEDTGWFFSSFGGGLSLSFGNDVKFVVAPGWIRFNSPSGAALDAFTLSAGFGFDSY